MRRSLLNKLNLSKSLRQALVLFTMLLLPSAAWGQRTVTVTKTIMFNQSLEESVSSNIDNSTFPVEVKEVVKFDENSTITYTYISRVSIREDAGVIDNYSCSNVETTFTLKNGDADNSNGFTILIPGTYPAEPSSVELKISYENTDIDDVYDYCAVIGVSNNEDNHFKVPSLEANDPKECTILFNAEGNETEFGTLKTTREKPEDLAIMVYLTAKGDNSTTFTIKEATITYETEFYDLSVAGIPVTGINTSAVLFDKNDWGNPDETGTVSFTPANNDVSPATPATLTLSGAKIGSATNASNIQVYVDNLIVKINGENSIFGYIQNEGASQSSSIRIEKAEEASSANLTLSDIQGFASCTWSDNLYLSAHNSDGGIIDVHYQHFEGEGGQMESYYGGDIADVTFSTTPSTAIWVAGISPGADGHFTGLNGVTYTPANTTTPATLTLEGASISTIENSPSPLIVCNGDLTVNLVGNENYISFSGNYSTYVFKNNATTGALTFTSDSENASLNITSECYEGTYKGLCDGFSTVNFNKDLGLFNRSGTKAIKNITGHAPVFNMSDGVCYWVTNEGILLNATYHYKIDYVDTSLEGSGVEVDLEADVTNGGFDGAYFDSSDLLGPCTITAYAKLNEAIIGSNKAKLFGPAETTITLNSKTLNSILTPDMLDIQPSIEENDGVNLTISESYDSNVIQISEETGTATIVGVGKCILGVNLSISETSNLTVLNPISSGIVTVLPDMPKIEKEEKDYLDTDKITIEGESADDIKIFYTWDADVVVENNSYVDNPDHSDITLSTYDSNNPIIAQSGTLRAWVGYHLGDDEYLMSAEASQSFTVKTDISKYTIEGLGESTTYTGTAITPTFTVVDQKETELASTNYTVSYQKVETTTGGEGVGSTEKLTDVDEMVEVGSYKIVVTGIGENYGGSKSVDFEITKADLEIVTIEAIPDQPYTGSEIKPEITVTLNGETVASDGNFYITYSQNTEVSTETYAYVTLTAIGTSECFIEGSTKTASFVIVPRSIEDVTVTMSGDGFDSEKYSFVYNGENQKPTVTVKDGERPLILDTDYTLTNNGGTNVGEYTFTITGKGNYDKDTSIELFYRITPKSIAGATINLDPDNTYVYNGGEQTPVFEVKDGETVLEKDVDYIVSYSNNINAAASTAENAPTFTITGKGNYDENTTAEAFFTINQADLQYAAISKIAFGGTEYSVGDPVEIPYTGEAIQPTVEEVLFNDGTVTLDASEYNVSYSNNTETSSDNLALVIITSKGKNFTAGTSTSQGFKIVPATVTITAEDQAVTYNANAQEYDVSKVEVSNNNAELAVTYYATEDERNDEENALEEAPTDAGTYYVQVTQTNSNYTAEAKNVTFTINQLELTNDNTVITLENEELTYNGQEQTVIVTKVMVGDIEVPIDCYEVSGNTEKEAGDYKLTVTAKTVDSSGNPIKNNFTGSAEKDWKIKNRTASAAELGFNSETQTFSTYYNPNEDLYLPDGYMSYVITGINDNNSVSTQRLTNIPKGIAVLVEKGTNSENPTDVVNNPDLPLKGTAEPREVSSITGGTVYVLYNGEFVKSTRGTIPAKRCYLLIENRAAAGTRAFGINHHMGANGIDSALLYDNDEKAGDKWHDLQGRSIEKPTKAGLYIKNGKKVVIK